VTGHEPNDGHGSQGDDVSYLKEALKWQYNWIGLLGAIGFALASGSGLPMLLAAGVELMYLSLVPQSSRFRRLVRSWKYAEQKRQQGERLRALLETLPVDLKRRYAGLEEMSESIRSNNLRLSATSQVFVEQLDLRLRGLLQSYLRLLHSTEQYREHLRSCPADSIRHEVDQLARKVESDAPKLQEINRKRIEILSKRLERFDKMRENQQVVEAQCRAIEDVLQLIQDQSLTLGDPQQISDQLDHLVQDVEQTEETVREFEAIFELATNQASLESGPTTATTILNSDSSGRRRIRN